MLLGLTCAVAAAVENDLGNWFGKLITFLPSCCSQLQAQMWWALSERGGRLSVWQWVQRPSRLLLGLWRCLCGAKYGLEQSVLIGFHSVLFYCIVLIGKRSVLVFTLIYRRPSCHAGKRFWALPCYILTWGGRKPVVLSFQVVRVPSMKPFHLFLKLHPHLLSYEETCFLGKNINWSNFYGLHV